MLSRKMILALCCAWSAIPSLAANTITATTTPVPANATASVTITANATVAQSLTISISDGVAAASGGVACQNVNTASIFSGGAGTNAGTCSFGAYDVDLTSGTPAGAQACPTTLGLFTAQTLSYNLNTPRSAQFQASIGAGSTWDETWIALDNNTDWSVDVPVGATQLTTTPTQIGANVVAGRSTGSLQLGWKVVATTAQPAAKTGVATLTLMAP